MSLIPSLTPTLPCLLLLRETTSTQSTLMLVCNGSGVPLPAPHTQFIMVPQIQLPASNSLRSNGQRLSLKPHYPLPIHTTPLATSLMTTISCNYMELPHLFHSPSRSNKLCQIPRRWTSTPGCPFFEHSPRVTGTWTYQPSMFHLCSISFDRPLSSEYYHPMYGCWTTQVFFPLYSSRVWLIYIYFSCSQRLKQLNFNFTKCKIPILRYISHIPWHLLGKWFPYITRPFPCLSEQFPNTDMCFHENGVGGDKLGWCGHHDAHQSCRVCRQLHSWACAPAACTSVLLDCIILGHRMFYKSNSDVCRPFNSLTAISRS